MLRVQVVPAAAFYLLVVRKELIAITCMHARVSMRLGMNEIPSRTTATAAALAIALWVHASMTHAPVELSTANSTAQSTGAAAMHGFHMLAPDDDGEIALSLYWRSVARKIALHPRAQLLHTPSAGPLVALVPKYLNATECDALINMHDAEKTRIVRDQRQRARKRPPAAATAISGATAVQPFDWCFWKTREALRRMSQLRTKGPPSQRIRFQDTDVVVTQSLACLRGEARYEELGRKIAGRSSSLQLRGSGELAAPAGYYRAVLRGVNERLERDFGLPPSPRARKKARGAATATEPVPALKVVTSLLSYGVGSGYGKHHDCKMGDSGRSGGGGGMAENEVRGGALHGNDRMLTMLLYLNDVAAGAGGQTRFPLLNNLTIAPARGTLLLWFNLGLDLRLGSERDSSAPSAMRPACLDSSLHEALPVLHGTKRVLQRWYHYGASPDVYNPGLHTVCDASSSCREYCEGRFQHGD